MSALVKRRHILLVLRLVQLALELDFRGRWIELNFIWLLQACVAIGFGLTTFLLSRRVQVVVLVLVLHKSGSLTALPMDIISHSRVHSIFYLLLGSWKDCWRVGSQFVLQSWNRGHIQAFGHTWLFVSFYRNGVLHFSNLLNTLNCLWLLKLPCCHHYWIQFFVVAHSCVTLWIASLRSWSFFWFGTLGVALVVSLPCWLNRHLQLGG